MHKPAILALANGSVFQGVSIGHDGQTVGEVVFNTAMTGYQEILTDPSYAQQIVTLTYPHIGNVGTNSEDEEAKKIWSAGLVIRDLSLLASNWRSTESLQDYLRRHHIVAIAEIDTRRLTRILRDQGAQNGCIMTGDKATPEQAIQLAQAFGGLNGQDLAKVVSVKHEYDWKQGVWHFPTGYQELPKEHFRYHVVAYDYGVKENILRLLVEQGCRLTVVPAQTPAEKVLALKPDGVFLSNGPGDPAACDYAITAIQELLKAKMPVFGICLGHQLLALACGAQTSKMKFGHHGANHPVIDLKTGRVMISSQNHGFMVDEATLPADLEITHRSLFDNTVQGIKHKQAPAFSFQGHPEASPGPHDVAGLFNDFIQLINIARGTVATLKETHAETY